MNPIKAAHDIARRRTFAPAFERLMLDNDRKLKHDAAIVIAAIRQFCRADQGTTIQVGRDGNVDPIASAVAAGRDEVWRQINFYLDVHPSELAAADRLYARESGVKVAEVQEGRLN